MCAIRLGGYGKNVGLGAAPQLASAKDYLITSIDFQWFGFLVFFDLYHLCHCFTELYPTFNNSLKIPENNPHPVHSNTIKTNKKLEQLKLYLKLAINFQFHQQSSRTLRLLDKASFTYLEL